MSKMVGFIRKSLGVLIVACLVPQMLVAAPRQLIFVGVDGLQVKRLETLNTGDALPNFKRLSANGGWRGSASITGHVKTVTAAGNAELYSGLGESVTNIRDNTCGRALPIGTSIFERLHSFESSIQLGLIYGKGTCYIPNAVLANAKPIVPWWHDRNTYPQTSYASANCADSRDPARKALEFLSAHLNDSFFLAIYFGVPDCAGHAFGVPSPGYDAALSNVDEALGILLDKLATFSPAPAVLLSADHGWNEGTADHSTPSDDTRTIPLISNTSSLVGRADALGRRKQCDIAPTILRFFGMKEAQFPDIGSGGCSSMATVPDYPRALKVTQADGAAG